MTSAPRSASCSVPHGPGAELLDARTRTSASGSTGHLRQPLSASDGLAPRWKTTCCAPASTYSRTRAAHSLRRAGDAVAVDHVLGNSPHTAARGARTAPAGRRRARADVPPARRRRGSCSSARAKRSGDTQIGIQPSPSSPRAGSPPSERPPTQSGGPPGCAGRARSRPPRRRRTAPRSSPPRGRAPAARASPRRCARPARAGRRRPPRSPSRSRRRRRRRGSRARPRDSRARRTPCATSAGGAAGAARCRHRA